MLSYIVISRCVCLYVCACVISKRFNQENGKSNTGLVDKTLTKPNEQGVSNWSVESGLIDGFVSQM